MTRCEPSGGAGEKASSRRSSMNERQWFDVSKAGLGRKMVLAVG